MDKKQILRTSTLLEAFVLRLEEGEVHFSGGVFSKTRKIPYGQIDAIVVADDGRLLAFQAGRDTYKMPVDVGKPAHKAVIDALVAAAAARVG